MQFTDIFIKRPVLAMVISLFIFFLGLKSIFNLDVRQYPKVENTLITITTAYPGAGPELIQGFITQPIQSAVSSAEGIDYISSENIQNTSIIKIKLRLNFDSRVAFTDILAKVNSVANQLPQAAQRPIITKSTGSSVSLLYVNYSSNKLNSQQIYDYLSRIVQPQLQTVAGVSSANLLGGNPFAMRVWLKPIEMAALNVSTEDINNALISNNYLSAAGQLKGKYTIINLNAHTDLHDVQGFKKIIIKQSNKRLIYLQDVADIELGSESYASSVTFNGQRGVFIGINALPSANPLTVISDVRRILPDIAKNLPSSIEQKIVYDSTKFISASIYDVIITLLEATAIVILVIFLFLGSLRAILIPVVTIPLSLIGVAFVMYVLGYSLNLLTLLAMVLAIGLVVDDAIVVLENIHRHMERGLSKLDAAILGAREITVPVITMTITLAAVYAPIGLMEGLTGALFKEFALTLAVSVIVSGIIALTLSPMMCAKILDNTDNNYNFAHKIDVIFSKIQLYYQNKLQQILINRYIVLLAGSIVFISVFFLFIFTPKELAPVEDQGFLFVVNSAPSYANLHYLEHYTQEMNNIFTHYPEHDAHFLINGASGENTGFGGIILTPWELRKRKAQQLQPLLQNQLNDIAGIKSFIFSKPDLPTGSDGMPVQFVIKSILDYKSLYDISQNLLIKAKKSGLFIIADSDLNFSTPELNIDIDREKAAQMNISMQQIGNNLSSFLGGNYLNFFSINGRSYKVIPQLPDLERYNPIDLSKSYLRTNTGSLVSLANFIHFTSKVKPSSLNQFQQLNSVIISAIMMPGQTQSTCLKFLRTEAEKIFPKGTKYDYAGESRVFINEGNSLLYTFIFALIVIFLVLAAQFESFRDPLIIMVSVPMAICGALIPLNIGLATINIYTEIGLVTLIGLITKHGILMVEFANQLRAKENLDIHTAIVQAAATRLRPILMTTSAMVFGVIPLVLASGAGASSRYNIGLVIASGLLVGTFFTLFIVPTMYLLITKKNKIVNN